MENTNGVSNRRPIRVVIADDHLDIRHVFDVVFGLDDDFAVVGHAFDGATAIEVTQATEPDVVLLDWQMPHVDGLTALEEIKRTRPETGVVLYSSRTEAEAAPAALAAGADRYAQKGADIDAVVELVRQVGRSRG